MSEQQSFGLTFPVTMGGNGAAVGAGSPEVTHRLEGHLEPPHSQSPSREQQRHGIRVSTMLRVNQHREERQVRPLCPSR